MPEVGLKLGRLPKSSGLIEADRARVLEVSRSAAPLKEKWERSAGALGAGYMIGPRDFRAEGAGAPSVGDGWQGPSNASIEVFLAAVKKPAASGVNPSKFLTSVLLVQRAEVTDPVCMTKTWRQAVDNFAPTC